MVDNLAQIYQEEPRMSFRRLALTPALTVVALIYSANLSFSVDLATPAGLNPGDSFRFVFVTGLTTNAASTNINFYNNLVATDSTGYTYGGQPITWKAIVSTTAIDARDNVGGYGSNTSIYMVEGTKVANNLTENAGGLWSGNLLTPLNRKIDGTVLTVTNPQTITTERVWTGTWQNGQGLVPQLGTPGPRYGRYDLSNNGWITQLTQNNTEISRLYGMSETFTIPVPEASTYVLGTVCSVVVMAIARRRRVRSAGSAGKV
jgi:hypothetical protein